MSTSPLFEFALWPITEVGAWRRGNDSYLHWFGLTAGWYTINCGGVRLMELNPAMIDATPNDQSRTRYFDYQLARLHSDMLEILPYAMDPVPTDIVDMVRSVAVEKIVEERSYRWFDVYCYSGDGPPAPCPNPFENRLDYWQHAFGWWTEKRSLSRGHCFGQPDIRMWSEGDCVTIRWTNDCGIDEETGLKWNLVPDGEHTMSFSTFMSEMRDFHDRLMNAMAERVEIARTAWPLPDVAINVAGMAEQHECERRSLDETIAQAASVRMDWDKVRWAMREVVRLVGE